MTKMGLTTGVAGLLMALSANAALADRIDGNWCSPDGMTNVHIDGPELTMSPGITITGQYTRHEFLYSLPEGDPNAGTEVYMRQLSEEQANVFVGEADPVIWHRCRAVVS